MVLVSLTPLSTKFRASLLKYNNLNILLDCGWNEELNEKDLAPVIEVIKGTKLNLILITHPDIEHVGALPYLCKKGLLEKNLPIVATEACVRLGELCMVGHYEDLEKHKQVLEFDLDDIVDCFQTRIVGLKFTQSFKLPAVNNNIASAALVNSSNLQSNTNKVNVTDHLVLRSFAAGRLLGGCFWHLSFNNMHDIIYAVDFQLIGERMLDGLQLDSIDDEFSNSSKKFDALITDSRPAETNVLIDLGRTKLDSVARNGLEERLLQEIIPCLKKGGSVLIPCDPNTRILELVLFLEKMWQKLDKKLQEISTLAWVSPVSDMILDQAKIRLNWMSHKLTNEFDKNPQKGHPFNLKHMNLFSDCESLLEASPLNQPKVIIAGSGSLESGDARDLFLKLAGDSANLLLTLQPGGENTLVGGLIQDFVIQGAKQKNIEITEHYKVALPDEELRQFYDQSMRKWEEQERKLAEQQLLLRKELEYTNDPEALRWAKMNKRKKDQVGCFFEPVGFKGARTFQPQSLNKVNSDEYGLRLTQDELQRWRECDSEGLGLGKFQDDTNQNENNNNNDNMDVDGDNNNNNNNNNNNKNIDNNDIDGNNLKKEQKFLAEENTTFDEKFDWKQDLRIKFREPKRLETRSTTVRVNMKVQYVPLSGFAGPQQVRRFVESVKAQNILVIPTSGAMVATTKGVIDNNEARRSEGLLQERLELINKVERPKIYLFDGSSNSSSTQIQQTVKFNLSGSKKRVLLDEQVWSKVVFRKLSGCENRIAWLAGELVQNDEDENDDAKDENFINKDDEKNNNDNNNNNNNDQDVEMVEEEQSNTILDSVKNFFGGSHTAIMSKSGESYKTGTQNSSSIPPNEVESSLEHTTEHNNKDSIAQVKLKSGNANSIQVPLRKASVFCGQVKLNELAEEITNSSSSSSSLSNLPKFTENHTMQIKNQSLKKTTIDKNYDRMELQGVLELGYYDLRGKLYKGMTIL